MIERKLHRVDEVAQILGICRSKAYALIADGTIPSCRLGRSLRVPSGALDQMLEQLEAEAVSNSKLSAQ